ncbi:MAG: pseudouridine-5'-phosphate glycosidase [Sumerlaeia bacterium]
MPLEDFLDIRPHVQDALASGKPLVALESTIITHGLPRPVNLETARGCEDTVRSHGAVPATIGIHDGKLVVGLESQEIAELANADDVAKTNLSNLAMVIAGGGYGATSVSTTLLAARLAGIRVVATGGIGGVHRGFGEVFDISSDLTSLAHAGGVLVSAGAKVILDVAATREHLETLGIPVVGWRTDWFPLFYSVGRDIAVDYRVEDASAVARGLHTHEALGLETTMLVVADPPEEDALDPELLGEAIEHAQAEAHEDGITGRDVTPYLLARIKDLTQGESLRANLSLIHNNCAIAAQIACALAKSGTKAAEPAAV